MVALVVVTVLVFTLLALRVVQLQALEPDRFVALSEEQTVRSFPLAADRGSILDRHGHELALSIPQQTIFTDPKFVEDPAEAAAQLAPILGLSGDDLEDQLAADNRFGYLARQVSDDVAEAVEGLDLPGVYTIEEPHRFAPSGDLATSLLGMTDIDNVGLGGLERQYEEVLAGTPGHLTFEQDPEGRTIAGGEHDLVAPEPGESIMLTIDRALQHEAEMILADHVEVNEAEAGMLVATDPGTGEILAMANVERSGDTGEVTASTNNLALTTVYEPGSVMKIVGMSGALEDGLVSPQGACVNAPDSIEVGGGTFSEYSPHGGGCWPLEDVIVKSSNTGSINIALMLGPERLSRYFSAFGLGQPTGLGFPNELSGYVRPVEEWWGTSIASMPIGQGISVTPLQMLLAYNTIANDGRFVSPSLVRATVDGEGHQHPTEAPTERRVVSAETAAQVRSMLTEVVTRGTATSARLDSHLVAGKTGTAQIPAPDGGYVFPDGTKHYMATFCGMVPAEAPRFSACVVIQHPTAGAYTGGAVAAPAFADFARVAVARLRIPPSTVELPAEDVGSESHDTEVEPWFTGLGAPPEGRVRAEPAGTAPTAPEASPTSGTSGPPGTGTTGTGTTGTGTTGTGTTGTGTTGTGTTGTGVPSTTVPTAASG